MYRAFSLLAFSPDTLSTDSSRIRSNSHLPFRAKSSISGCRSGTEQSCGYAIRAAYRRSVFRRILLVLVSLVSLIDCSCIAAANGFTSASISNTLVTRLVVTPSSPKITMGNTQHFIAIAEDMHGQPIAGVAIRWSSDATSVAK
jgi:hypothetical protein